MTPGGRVGLVGPARSFFLAASATGATGCGRVRTGALGAVRCGAQGAQGLWRGWGSNSDGWAPVASGASSSDGFLSVSQISDAKPLTNLFFLAWSDGRAGASPTYHIHPIRPSEATFLLPVVAGSSFSGPRRSREKRSNCAARSVFPVSASGTPELSAVDTIL